jgi:hypothetical protein
MWTHYVSKDDCFINHPIAGQKNCFPQLRALLVLHDRGNVLPKILSCGKQFFKEQFLFFCNARGIGLVGLHTDGLYIDNSGALGKVLFAHMWP